MKFTGIVLAGGKSSRMGQDKGLMFYRGKPMVSYSIDLLKQFCSEIIISSNNSEYIQFGYPVINDIYTNCGPIGGLHASLSYSSSDWNLVIPCDSPNLEADLYSSMIKIKDDYEIIVPQYSNRIEPLAGIYHKNIVPFLDANIINNEFKLQTILSDRNTCYFDASMLLKKYPSLFSNINTPEDSKM